MNQVWQIVFDHRFSIGTALWYVVSSAIVTMPDKGEPFRLYPWIYDFTHQILNLKPIAGLTDRLPAGSMQVTDAHRITVTPSPNQQSGASI